ncbi:MAG: hypothetical protein Q4G08_11340 [Capnocytophaga sp.]|nr:hypothetical protein [Capnocytophaga sp.]
MKIKIIFIALTGLLLAGCPYENHIDDNYYSAYKPEVMKRSDFEQSIEVIAPSPLSMKKAGKIYLKDQWLLLGDTNLGFHIYDNSNPESPTYKAFLKIPGATDLAIRDNIFYVNQAVDLVAFSYDFATQNVTVLKRIPQAFPKKISPDGYSLSIGNDEVVVNWIQK